MNWFVVIEGRREGPYDTDHVIERLLTQSDPEDGLVWQRGFPQWTTAASVPELRMGLPPPIPSPKRDQQSPVAKSAQVPPVAIPVDLTPITAPSSAAVALAPPTATIADEVESTERIGRSIEPSDRLGPLVSELNEKYVADRVLDLREEMANDDVFCELLGADDGDAEAGPAKKGSHVNPWRETDMYSRMRANPDDFEPKIEF